MFRSRITPSAAVVENLKLRRNFIELRQQLLEENRGDVDRGLRLLRFIVKVCEDHGNVFALKSVEERIYSS